MAKKKFNPHADWLRLLETNSPLLSASVLLDAYPQGLPSPSTDVARRLRWDYEEWKNFHRQHRTGTSQNENLLQTIDNEWIASVIKSLLGWPDSKLVSEEGTWANLIDTAGFQSVSSLVHKSECKLIIAQFAYDKTPSYLDKTPGHITSPVEELVKQARQSEGAPRIALVTNGECWTLVAWLPDCPITHATWYAQDWRREPLLLNAFATLFSYTGICKPKNNLVDLLLGSTKTQEAATDTMGEQVQRAIEVLVQSLDRADAANNRGVLKSIGEKQLYEASLTVMMRLVFILCAEGRRLLPFGEAFYDDNYAISTLRQSLQNQADAIGEEVLENRFDAWGRFLALCRVIHNGCEHEDMRFAALGGSLFYPSRYPFLDGVEHEQQPLPVDNRTFLYLLEALQVIDHPGGAEFVSYASIDVEQIGHIYEGLLELKISRSNGITLRLKTIKKAAKSDWLLSELESLCASGRPALLDALNNKETGIGVTRKRINDRLDAEIPESLWAGLLMACDGNVILANRIKPFVNLLQIDAWGRPIVYQDNALMVTTGTSRRGAGAYYTPRPLAESIVKTTIDPLIYDGMADGKPESDWQMKSAKEILALKICDPAMGSGAFLVQCCRYLSEKLVSAWCKAEAQGNRITADGRVVDHLGSLDPISNNVEDRFAEAKRFIAERCLYGVDLNPMAVELAKLSIWLETLSKGRPFGFLDHCLGCGDSLLGITDAEDLYAVGRQAGLFGAQIEESVRKASRIRRQIESEVILDIHDVERKQLALRRTAISMEPTELLADVLLLEKLKESISKHKSTGKIIGLLALSTAGAFQNDPDAIIRLQNRRVILWKELQGAPINTFNPFHYALRFPEVFQNGGFDAIIGNPPFIGNKFWKTTIGTIADFEANYILEKKHGKIDISVVFHRRSFDLLKPNGVYGLLGTTNISEGEAVKVGLEHIVRHGTIYTAVKSLEWPGSANINVAIVHAFKGEWNGKKMLNGLPVQKIYQNLTSEAFGTPKTIFTKIAATKGPDGTFMDMLTIPSTMPIVRKILSESNKILIPIVTGKTINNSSLEFIDNYVINSENLSLNEIKNESETAYQFLLSVREARLNKIQAGGDTYKGWKDRWWQHWNTRANFFKQYPHGTRLIYATITKYPIPRLVNNVLTQAQGIILPVAFPDQHTLLLSSAMQHWLTTFSGAKKGADPVSITLVLSSIHNYPCPKARLPETVHDRAIEFDNYLRNQGGVTPAMNRFHDPEDTAIEVERARELQRLLDEAVIAAYGWNDLDLTYEFSNQGIGERYGLKYETRKELLRRLVALNNSYWEEQQKLVASEDAEK